MRNSNGLWHHKHPLSSRPTFSERVRWHLRVKRYSIRTENTYLDWIRRFILFHGKRHPAEMGEGEIAAFLSRKWQRELDYRLIKEVWAFAENRIAVRFAYEWHDDSGQWFRSYGNENWEFDAEGLMAVRHASINDLVIGEAERKYRWPLGRRPDGHPSLSELGL